MTGPARRPPSSHRRRRHAHAPARTGRTLIWLALLVVVALGAAFAVFRESGGGGGEPPATTAAEAPPVPLTFPEGMRREDMAKLVARETGLSGSEYLRLTGPGAEGRRLAGTGRPTSLEGFLFPATYQIGSETTVRRLVDAQVAAYQGRVAGIDYRYARSRNLTPYDVLIIASMIEREVQDPRERKLVASVIYNRLKADMRLDIDATVHYAVGSWDRPLTQADLDSDSPYNTRRFKGLPPGPISNPGESSIAAAARPAGTDYLYYVARNDGSGRHYFSSTAAQFEADVARAQANGGG